MNENCGKITITNTIKALGDFFYRNCQCILFGIFMVCLCIIVQIKFKIVPFLHILYMLMRLMRSLSICLLAILRPIYSIS